MPVTLSRRARFAATFAVLAAASLPCTATVCTASASALAFGLYDTLLASNGDTAGTVTVTCTPGLGSPLQSNYTITIAGTGAAGDTVRAVTSGSRRLYFQLYKDPARSVVWGNGGSSGPGVTSSVVSASTVLPAAQTHTVYARMSAGQKVPPGLYLGGLQVTVDY